ncbi:hypothetical protein AB668_02155 [Mycoplasma sp. HU2014]|nr:hypothetical protein AB668_02155 [Mycoplasma sp. HU2014]
MFALFKHQTKNLNLNTKERKKYIKSLTKAKFIYWSSIFIKYLFLPLSYLGSLASLIVCYHNLFSSWKTIIPNFKINDQLSILLIVNLVIFLSFFFFYFYMLKDKYENAKQELEKAGFTYININQKIIKKIKSTIQKNLSYNQPFVILLILFQLFLFLVIFPLIPFYSVFLLWKLYPELPLYVFFFIFVFIASFLFALSIIFLDFCENLSDVLNKNKTRKDSKPMSNPKTNYLTEIDDFWNNRIDFKEDEFLLFLKEELINLAKQIVLFTEKHNQDSEIINCKECYFQTQSLMVKWNKRLNEKGK